MSHRFGVTLVLALLSTASLCQTESGTVPTGTPLALTIDQHYPMRAGQSIRAHLLYPIYADNKLLLPQDTVVAGSVVVLRSDRSRRVRASLGGDFTLFRVPAKGTPIYRAVAPPPSKGGVIHQQFDAGLTAARSDLAAFISPGKGDRLVQFIYSQIPYHPQRIEKGTSWTVETLAPVEVPSQTAVTVPPPPPAHKAHFWEPQTLPTNSAAENTGSWIIQANLADPLSSESSKTGQTIKAVVAEPIYDASHTLVVPQGATLIGAVTRAKPARMFGRTGTLSFSFSQLMLPDSETQTVETRLTGADSAQDIALNSEGQAKSKPKDKVSIPLLLSLMASRPLDQDHHGASYENGTFKNGVGGSAGLGLIGTVTGLAGGSPYAAAGIGYWGAARALYSRWIARGQKITFAKDTRIVVETTPRRSAPIKPNSQP